MSKKRKKKTVGATGDSCYSTKPTHADCGPNICSCAGVCCKPGEYCQDFTTCVPCPAGNTTCAAIKDSLCNCNCCSPGGCTSDGFCVNSGCGDSYCKTGEFCFEGVCYTSEECCFGVNQVPICCKTDGFCCAGDVCCDKGTVCSNHSCGAGDLPSCTYNGQTNCYYNEVVANTGKYADWCGNSGGGYCSYQGADTCCTAIGSICVDGLCCAPGETRCGSNCCAAGMCCNNTCCAPGQVCVNGACCDHKCSDGHCCNGGSAMCCGSGCCDSSETCCGSSCCSSSETCHDNAHCCDKDERYCNGHCCGELPHCCHGNCCHNNCCSTWCWC